MKLQPVSAVIWASLISSSLASMCVVPEPLVCSGKIPVSDLSVSSELGIQNNANYSCLETVAVQGQNSGAWSASTNDANQWIQVEFDKDTLVQAITTLGRADAAEWVSSFTLQYSSDGATWTDITQHGSAAVYQANRDQTTEVYSVLPTGIVTKYIRLKPASWNGHISMRWQLHGCYEPTNLCSSSSAQVCSGTTRTAAVTTSSVSPANSDVDNVCIDKTVGSWSAGNNDLQQWIKVEIPEWSSLTSIITQGRADADQWVTLFTVEYSLDDIVWMSIVDPRGNPITFSGNTDRNTKVQHTLPEGLIARYLKINPKSWHGHISMRLETTGCLLDELPLGFNFPLSSQDLVDIKEPDYTDEETERVEAEYNSLYNEITTLRNEDPNEEYDINGNRLKKRGIASVIVVAITVGTEAYLLANALNSGCVSNPNICTYRDQIQDLQPQIDSLKETYDDEYTASQIEYIQMRNSLYENDYLLYYTNETIMAVKNIDQMYKDIVADLNVRLPTLSALAANGSMTSDEYLNSVLGTLALGLEDVDKMISQAQHNSYMSIAINMGATMFVGYWLNNYQLATEQVGGLAHTPHQKVAQLVDADINARAAKTLGVDLNSIPTEAQYNTLGSRMKGAWAGFSYSAGRQFRIIGQTFKNMATRPFTYAAAKFQGAVGAVMNPRRSYNRFRVSMAERFNYGLARMRNGLNSLRSGRFLQFQITGFKFSWSSAAAGAITVAMSAVAIAMDKAQWDQVEDNIHTALIQTQSYHQSLVGQLELLRNDTAEMQVVWAEASQNFKDISQAFAEMITNATENSAVVDATTIGFHYDLSNPIFTDDYFVGINKTNLPEKQAATKAFLSSVNNDYFAARNALFGRVTFYDKLNADYADGDSVDDMFSIILDILRYSAYTEAQEFGTTLRKQDVVCYIALVYSVERTRYDHYLLSSMLPNCDITDDEWVAIETDANEARYLALMTGWVQVDVNAGGIPVSYTLDAVRREFNRQDNAGMTSYANSLTEKDILCVIITLTGADTYDFIDLAIFRSTNPCTDVTPSQLASALADADTQRAKVDDVLSDMEYCQRRPSRCDCPSDLADWHSVSLDELTTLMKLAMPDETEYCGADSSCDPECLDLS